MLLFLVDPHVAPPPYLPLRVHSDMAVHSRAAPLRTCMAVPSDFSAKPVRTRRPLSQPLKSPASCTCMAVHSDCHAHACRACALHVYCHACTAVCALHMYCHACTAVCALHVYAFHVPYTCTAVHVPPFMCRTRVLPCMYRLSCAVHVPSLCACLSLWANHAR